MTRATVMLCCNHPDGGYFTGKVSQIDVTAEPDGIAAELEGKQMAVRYDFKLGRVFLGGAPFPIKGYTQWLGNWCWDGVGMAPETACRLLEYLRTRGWELNAGYDSLWRPYHDGLSLTPTMLAGDEVAS